MRGYINSIFMSQSSFVLVLTGSSGAGKGTQAQFLEERLGFYHIDVGRLLRERANAGDEFGKQLGDIMAQGKFIPDDLANAVVNEGWLGLDRSKVSQIVIDGYPRSQGQAQALRTTLNYLGIGDVLVVWIQVDDDEVVHRLMARGRADDTKEAIQKRIDRYHAEVVPGIEHLREQYTVAHISGLGSEEEVHQSIVVAIKTALKDKS